jgi:hypothetical protein
MAAVVAALRAVMGADTAEFERKMKDVEGTLQKVAAVGAFVGTALTSALGNAFSSIQESIKKAIESADKMDEMAESIGISVEKLSGLRFAADLSGVSLDALSTSMVKLGKAMAESVQEPGSTSARTFQAMGISVVDAEGKLRSINDVFLEIADKFRTYEDGAGKVTLATNLFGRAGAANIPLLNQGSDGIARQADEAARLGLTLDTKTVKAAAAFNDSLTKMGRVWDGIIMQLTAKLVPTLETVANWMTTLNQKSQALQVALSAVDVVFKTLIGSGIVLKAAFEIVVSQIGFLLSILEKLAARDLSGAWEQFRRGPVETANAVQSAIDKFKELIGITQQWETTTQSASDNAASRAAPIVAGANAIRDANREWMDEQRAELDTFLASSETRLAKMAEIQVALQTGVINQRTYGQMVRSVEKENQNAITSTASLMASTLTSVFSKNKAAAIAAAIISTCVGITNAMAGPPTGPPWPFNIAQAALVAASGAAQIAKISSTSMSGGGGSAPAVSGGGGGGGDAAASAPSQAITLNLSGSSRFTAEEVRGLMEQFGEAVADGGVLVATNIR